jgi:radical SAM/Cys-rich protein
MRPEPDKIVQFPLEPTVRQQETLNSLDLTLASGVQADFEKSIAHAGWLGLHPLAVEIFQINLGKLCNMNCRHCHVDAGPHRSDQVMSRETVDACLRALDLTTAPTVDLTGGAPEMNPHFQYLVEEAVSRGKHVIDRCNLTILLAPGFTHLPQWMAEHGVEIFCSLPHYRPRNTDNQRGDGTFEKSIRALKQLNDLGYGKGDPHLKLTLVANPAGAFLAANQCAMEQEWERELKKNHDISFDSLITLNNMPISRFLEWLESSDNLQDYMELLVNSFNPQTVEGLMCRNTLSVSWEGLIYDCDFNQMLEIEVTNRKGDALFITDFDPDDFRKRRIRTARHCYGCTAGSGSSCGGALAE